MYYANTHRECSNAPILSKIVSSTTLVDTEKLILAASVDSILVYYRCRMNSKQEAANVFCNCTKRWLSTGTYITDILRASTPYTGVE